MPDKKTVQAACAALMGFLAIIAMMIVGAAAGGCATYKTDTLTKNHVQKMDQSKDPPMKKWELPKRCKVMDTLISTEFTITVHHNCLKDGVVTLAVAFLVPYKKTLVPKIAKAIRGMMGEVSLSLFTMGRSKGLPFFLFIVNKNY